MPRPVKLNGTDKDTKLLGALVHWVMHNNLLTIVNKYPAIQASRDFDGTTWTLNTPQSHPRQM